MTTTNLDQRYHEQLRVLFSTESQLVAAIANLAIHTTDPQLKRAFNVDLNLTRSQRANVLDLLTQHEIDLYRSESPVIRRLIRETKGLVRSGTPGRIRDAALLAYIGKIKRFKISAYGEARSLAKRLGYDDDALVILHSLVEEQSADKELHLLRTTLLSTAELAGAVA